MIKLRQLTKSFSGQKVLDKLDLDIRLPAKLKS